MITVGRLRKFLDGIPASAEVRIEDLGSDQGITSEVNSLLYTKERGVELNYHKEIKNKGEGK